LRQEQELALNELSLFSSLLARIKKEELALIEQEDLLNLVNRINQTQSENQTSKSIMYSLHLKM
jgi:hypothetical protein